MNFSLKTLPSGLRILAVPIAGLASATLTLWVKTGSRMEEAGVNGISHFLEHMFFKGTKKRPDKVEIAETLDRVGGAYNAPYCGGAQGNYCQYENNVNYYSANAGVNCGVSGYYCSNPAGVYTTCGRPEEQCTVGGYVAYCAAVTSGTQGCQ